MENQYLLENEWIEIITCVLYLSINETQSLTILGMYDVMYRMNTPMKKMTFLTVSTDLYSNVF